MLIVGENLKQLCLQNTICEENLIEEFSLGINLGRTYYVPKVADEEVIFGRGAKRLDYLFEEKKEIHENLIIESGEQVLAASEDIFKIPQGYFGMVQTKGTLARLFVMATCNDGQVEPGFDGHITLEIVNLSPWKIAIPFRENIAQLFLFKCSTAATQVYNGRYANDSKHGPTLPIFK